MPCNVHLFNLRTLSHDKFYTVPDSSALIILNKQSNGDELCNKNTFNCDQFNDKEDIDSSRQNKINFELNQPIKIKKVVRTTLTGNDIIESPPLSQPVNEEHKNVDMINGVEPTDISSDLKNITSSKLLNALSNLDLETMALETFKVIF